MAALSTAPMAALAQATRRMATYRPSVGVRLVVPAAMVLATLVMADLLRWIFPGSGVFLLLLLSVVVSATALGTVSGLVALALGLAGAVLLASQRSHPWLTESTDVLRALPYLFIGGFTVLVASALRSSLGKGPVPIQRATGTLVEPLTEREAEVLSLAASGLRTREIGERLYLSGNTVKSHLAHAYAKLGAHNRAEAIAAGLHAGALDGRVVTSRAAQITAGRTRPSGSLDAGGLPGAATQVSRALGR